MAQRKKNSGVKRKGNGIPRQTNGYDNMPKAKSPKKRRRKGSPMLLYWFTLLNIQ